MWSQHPASLWDKNEPFCLDLRPIPWVGIHIWYYKPGQKPEAKKFIRPSGKASAAL